MSKFSELVTHIENLKKSNVSQATLDVDFLYDALQEVSPDSIAKPTKDEIQTYERLQGRNLNLDGGKFGKE